MITYDRAKLNRWGRSLALTSQLAILVGGRVLVQAAGQIAGIGR